MYFDILKSRKMIEFTILLKLDYVDALNGQLLLSFLVKQSESYFICIGHKVVEEWLYRVNRPRMNR